MSGFYRLGNALRPLSRESSNQQSPRPAGQLILFCISVKVFWSALVRCAHSFLVIHARPPLTRDPVSFTVLQTSFSGSTAGATGLAGVSEAGEVVTWAAINAMAEMSVHIIVPPLRCTQCRTRLITELAHF
jgi:hypothetical protein